MTGGPVPVPRRRPRPGRPRGRVSCEFSGGAPAHGSTSTPGGAAGPVLVPTLSGQGCPAGDGRQVSTRVRSEQIDE
jgi:hypothetical protein